MCRDDAKNVAQNIKRFLEEHDGITLHPGRTPEAQGDLVVQKGGCPCVPGRPKCPCVEAMDDIKAINHCRCYLFVNDSYLKEYQRVVINGKKKRQGGVGKSPGTAGVGNPAAG